VDFVWDNPGELVPDETFTHSTHSHLSWSSIIPYLLPPSVMIHDILSVQFTCLTVLFHNRFPSFFGLHYGLAPSTSYSIHFFSQSLSSFHSTCPYHRNLFCCCTEIMQICTLTQAHNPTTVINNISLSVSIGINCLSLFRLQQLQRNLTHDIAEKKNYCVLEYGRLHQRRHCSIMV